MVRARSLPGRRYAIFVVVGLVAAWKSTSFASWASSLTGATSPSISPRGLSISQRVKQSLHATRAIEWCEPLDPNIKELEPSGDDGTLVLPVFPLGGPFMPYTKQKLNIFEPRYRELYDHILLSGSRRFVVTSVDPQSPADLRLAQAGVVFYLDDLQEVSEMTQDQVKYVCDHTVIGRVRIKRVLNPSSWFDRSTYLRAETEAIEDIDTEEDCWKLEGEVMDFLRKLVPLYEELKKPCYRANVLQDMNSSRSEEGGLWSLTEMWIQLLQAQLRVTQQGFEKKMQEIVMPYLKPDNVISIDDLPSDARVQIEQLRADYIEQVKSTEIQQLEFAQKMIQTDTHQGRLEYFKDILDEEYRASIAKKSLKNL